MIDVFGDFLKELLAPVFDWIINFFHSPGWKKCVVLGVIVLIGAGIMWWRYENTPMEGTTGEGLQWALDKDGRLTISGSGAMTDFADSESTPWYEKQKKIKMVVIDHGVATVGAYSFGECVKLDSVTIPKSVITIGDGAFDGCTSLSSVSIPANVQLGYTVFPKNTTVTRRQS